jgi:hypothetical protein
LEAQAGAMLDLDARHTRVGAQPLREGAHAMPRPGAERDQPQRADAEAGEAGVRRARQRGGADAGMRMRAGTQGDEQAARRRGVRVSAGRDDQPRRDRYEDRPRPVTARLRGPQ